MAKRKPVGSYRSRGETRDRKVHAPLLAARAKAWPTSAARTEAITRLAAHANITEAEATRLVG